MLKGASRFKILQIKVIFLENLALTRFADKLSILGTTITTDESKVLQDIFSPGHVEKPWDKRRVFQNIPFIPCRGAIGKNMFSL